jgi:hypothetical protein
MMPEPSGAGGLVDFDFYIETGGRRALWATRRVVHQRRRKSCGELADPAGAVHGMQEAAGGQASYPAALCRTIRIAHQPFTSKSINRLSGIRTH